MLKGEVQPPLYGGQVMSTRRSIFVGMDVSKKTIHAAVAYPGRDKPRYLGAFDTLKDPIGRILKRLNWSGEVVSFCYEAGPGGFQLYHKIRSMGHECDVVAPNLVPRSSADRVKTDRRDSLKLARAHRDGALTAVWVPDESHEAIRDLTRSRESARDALRVVRQKMLMFLDRHGRRYTLTKSNWTKTHYKWLADQKFENRHLQVHWHDTLESERFARRCLSNVEQRMRDALADWQLRPLVENLQALRGLQLISAMTIVAELGDMRRFPNPRKLMSYIGMVPAEYSSGERCQRGSITKSGNAHVRAVLGEAAWHYRFPARNTSTIRRRGEHLDEDIQQVAWDAQKRLSKKFRHLVDGGKQVNKACTAVGRELLGFIWAIAQQTELDLAG